MTSNDDSFVQDSQLLEHLLGDHSIDSRPQSRSGGEGIQPHPQTKPLPEEAIRPLVSVLYSRTHGYIPFLLSFYTHQ